MLEFCWPRLLDNYQAIFFLKRLFVEKSGTNSSSTLCYWTHTQQFKGNSTFCILKFSSFTFFTFTID